MHTINKALIVLFRFPSALVAPFTTLLFTLATILTFGLFALAAILVKNWLFHVPTYMASLAYEKGGPLGKVLAVLGLPFALAGSIVSTLIGGMGDVRIKLYDMFFFELFPYSYSFHKFIDGAEPLHALSPGARTGLRTFVRFRYKIFDELLRLIREGIPAAHGGGYLACFSV